MDEAVVSNNYGMNGHAETALERLVEGRKEHPLRLLGEFSDQEILDLTGVHPFPTFQQNKQIACFVRLVLVPLTK